MPGRFKDYIAIPRVNGYQSLHTTLFGPNGIPIEVQIRSEQMHRVAESGIAAHWKYKSGGDTFGGVEHDRAREWLASLVQIQEGGSSEEFLESVKVDCSRTRFTCSRRRARYCGCPAAPPRWTLRMPSTPTSAIAAWPRRSTGAWFRCARLCRNGTDGGNHHGEGRDPEPVMVELPGDREGARRDPDVPEELKRGEALELGRRLLGLALEEFSLNLKKIPAANIDAVVKELNLKDAAELYEKIGLGERMAPFGRAPAATRAGRRDTPPASAAR